MVVDRSTGQWALGQRDPLNPNERLKQEDDGLLVRQRILEKYQYTGFGGIEPGDLRGRLRWYGLYTQRRPGIPGGDTARLAPEELDDEFFMMRIRVDGGALTDRQLRVVGEIATEFGRDLADITDRQNIQLHWIRIEDVPEIWRRLDAVGLNTTEACGDTPRVILGCPLEGVAEDSVLDASDAIRSIAARYVGDPAFSNLPRKFKTAISGCSRHCVNHEINDVSFVGVVGPDGTPGFDLWVGGGLSTNPMFSQRVGVLVRPDEVGEVWESVISIFRDYGYRRSRQRARLKFLVADWGVVKFRQVLQQEYLRRELPDGPAPRQSPAYRSHAGIERQINGRVSVGAVTECGRTSGTALQAVAALATRVGLPDGGRVRLTPQQGLIVLNVDPDLAESTADELTELGLSARPSVFHRGTMACTGIEFCKLALVETKGRANLIQTELDRRLPGFDTPITINVNGCPNSCARFQIADIGFKGIVQKEVDGDVEGFQVHLGGQLGAEASFARKLRGLKVTAEQAPDYAERVLRGYLERRADGESFATYVRRAKEAWLI
jgi:sulfite reductase (ferredoxin)